MSEPLQWIFAADRLPDADARVLLWLQAPDGSQDWDVGHMDADGWVLDWCGAAPAGQVLAWAQPAGPDATATPPGSGRDVLEDLHAAAAAKWRGNPSAQRAGLFARAAAEIERLRLIAADAERWAAECNRRDDHLSAWHAACDFIDAHCADPDMTPKMVRTYAEFQRWREHLKTPNVEVSRRDEN